MTAGETLQVSVKASRVDKEREQLVASGYTVTSVSPSFSVTTDEGIVAHVILKYTRTLTEQGG